MLLWLGFGISAAAALWALARQRLSVARDSTHDESSSVQGQVYCFVRKMHSLNDLRPEKQFCAGYAYVAGRCILFSRRQLPSRM